MLTKHDTPEVRFRARVTLNGKRWLRPLLEAPSDQCLIWSGTKNESGYGYLDVDKKHTKAHRYSYFLAHGKWPPADMQILHSCDNPACVNPHHLSVGTNADNMLDMRSKGRHSHGEKVSIITTAQAEEAMRRLGAGEPGKEIARDLGVHFQTISDIKNGRTWTHLSGTNGLPTIEQMRSAKPKSKFTAKMTEDMAREAKRRLAAGESAKSIARSMGLSASSIDCIKQGRTWAHVSV